MYYPIRQIGRHNNWFRGTCWCKKPVKKLFQRTSWCNKWFRKFVVDGSDPKHQSKCSYSHYHWNFGYWHYQHNSNTKIIHQPNHPSCLPTYYPARHRWSGVCVREFEPAPDNSPADECHRRGAPLRAHFPYYWERNWDGKGPRHAKGHLFLQNEV